MPQEVPREVSQQVSQSSSQQSTKPSPTEPSNKPPHSGPPQIWAVVPAAGVGQRMQSDIPKQYLPLLDSTVIDITLSKLANLDFVVGVIVALAEADDRWQKTLASKHTKIHTVIGGSERADSVLAGIKFCRQHAVGSPAWVLVHDAARPCVSEHKIRELIQKCLGTESRFDGQGAILAAPCADTVKRAHHNEIVRTEDRSELWLAHTPQFFPAQLLETALTFAKENAHVVTDEASAVEAQGGRVAVVADRRDNIKITLPEDLIWAETILRQQGFTR